MANIQALLPYKMGSVSAKALATALHIKRIKLVGSRFRHHPNKWVINWGNTQEHPRISLFQILNKQQMVNIASNKIATLTKLSINELPTLEWTTFKGEAYFWHDEGHTVYVRHLTRASSGRGIEIIEPGMELPDAPLYTKHFKKHKEYRVHVGIKPNGERSVIHIQQKRLREDAPEGRTEGIRNHANGWIFACNNVDPLNDQQLKVAMDGVAALGLNFGGVDLLVDREGNAVICEINSAPGIEGTTLQQYVNFFRSI